MDIVGVLAILTVLLGSVAVGQALRITYTTAFFTENRGESLALQRGEDVNDQIRS